MNIGGKDFLVQQNWKNAGSRRLRAAPLIGSAGASWHVDGARSCVQRGPDSGAPLLHQAVTMITRRTLLRCSSAAPSSRHSCSGSRTAPAQHATCDRVGTTSIAFGRTAGNIKPAMIAASRERDPRATRLLAHVAMATVAPADVRRLARRGWTGPFAKLPHCADAPDAQS